MERVFSVLLDDTANKEWIPNLAEFEYLDQTDEKVGSTIREVYNKRGKEMEMHGVTTAHEPHHHHACEMSGNTFDLAVECNFTEQGTTTTLCQNTEITFHGLPPKIMVVILYRMMIRMSKKQNRDSLRKLKALCEQKAEQDATASYKRRARDLNPQPHKGAPHFQ
jgi:hypothetical protein